MPSRPPEARARRAEKQRQAVAVQNSFIENVVGGMIIVAFQDGKQVIGTLLGHDAYTLHLQVALKNGETEMLVYKHAVKYIATAPG